jgi:hypothetical protein
MRRPILASVLLFASQCDGTVGDETDFPGLVLLGSAACGARTLAGF